MARVRTHTNPLNIRHRFSSDTLSATDFSSSIDLEIGFGRGVFLRNWAGKYPNHSVFGVEVRKPIVEILQTRISDLGLNNVEIFHGNGHFFIEDCFPDESLDRVFVFHPDPWFKKKHHKRRVVNCDFLSLLKKKLKPSGRLYVSTDVEVLWLAMKEDIEKIGFKSCDDEFWGTDYLSHWDDFSKREDRNRFYQTYVLD